MSGHGNYKSHLSIYGKADCFSDIGVISFLDILIAVREGKKRQGAVGGGVRGRSHHVT